MAIIEDKLPETINEILAQFGIEKLESWSMIHNGHINRTYIIEFKKSKYFYWRE